MNILKTPIAVLATAVPATTVPAGKIAEHDWRERLIRR
jgi:hypothetical protein